MNKIEKWNDSVDKKVSLKEKLFNNTFLSVKNKVTNIIYASTLFFYPLNAGDNIWKDYHDFLCWIEWKLKNIWLLDENQDYRAQLYLLFEKDALKHWFKFRSDNDLFKWEFSDNSAWIWFIDKNDIYNKENIEVFYKYWLSHYEKGWDKKFNYWISTWINLNDYDLKLEGGIFNKKLKDFSKDEKVIYSEIVKNFYPEDFSKVRFNTSVYNYDWENHLNTGLRTYYWSDFAFEWEYDSSKINNGTNIWFQIFVKFYKSWPEVHTKVHYKNWGYTFRVINQLNVINQPDDTRLFFENNVLWF